MKFNSFLPNRRNTCGQSHPSRNSGIFCVSVSASVRFTRSDHFKPHQSNRLIQEFSHFYHKNSHFSTTIDDELFDPFSLTLLWGGGREVACNAMNIRSLSRAKIQKNCKRKPDTHREYSSLPRSHRDSNSGFWIQSPAC